MSRRGQKHSNPSAVKARLEKLQKGVSTVLSGSKPFQIDGETLTPQEIVERLAACIAPIAAAEVAQMRASQAVHDRDESSRSTMKFVDDLEAAIRGSIGTTSSALEQFGLKPKRSPRRRSSEKANDAQAPVVAPAEHGA